MNPHTPTAAWFDNQIGRQPSLAPSHLTRILYIPRHDNSTVHLPIYEAGDRYRSAVGSSLLGSTLYTTMLGFMKTPCGDHMADKVEYLADMHKEEMGFWQIHLDRRELETPGSNFQLTMAASPAGDTPTVFVRSGNVLTYMNTHFPIPESIRGTKTIRHPYFILETTQADKEASVKLEWQIHPAKDGTLRYTLVEQNRSSDSTIYAIYHHMHWELSLSVPYSEGVLLLPELEQNTEFEGIVLTSLLGVLAQLRMLSAWKPGVEKPGRVDRIMRRATTIFGPRLK